LNLPGQPRCMCKTRIGARDLLGFLVRAPKPASPAKTHHGRSLELPAIVGTVWARTASARPRRVKATGAVVTTTIAIAAIDAIASWCARRSCIDDFVDGFAIAQFGAAIAISAHPPHTGQALI